MGIATSWQPDKNRTCKSAKTKSKPPFIIPIHAKDPAVVDVHYRALKFYREGRAGRITQIQSKLVLGRAPAMLGLSRGCAVVLIIH